MAKPPFILREPARKSPIGNGDSDSPLPESRLHAYACRCQLTHAPDGLHCISKKELNVLTLIPKLRSTRTIWSVL